MKVKQQLFGTLPDGRPVHKFIIPSRNDMEVHILTWGGIITTITVPDKKGTPVDVALGFDSLDGYLVKHPFFGAMVGRYANRIGGAAFTLDGKEYPLAANNNGNHLHGGTVGFDKILWKGISFESSDRRGVILRHTSPDGDEGYPGNLRVAITCTVTDTNDLEIKYHGESDAATPVNLTNHSYFNFTGGSDTILGHLITINADSITEVNEKLIPTGKLISVEDTPFDFREQHTIGSRISDVPGGYDHNYCLGNQEETLHHAGQVHEPVSGITMDVETTKPGMQFYTGNFLDGTLIGKGGRPCEKHSGFCLETQFYPDSPNQDDFPDSILRPGEEYRHTTVYRFSAKQTYF